MKEASKKIGSADLFETLASIISGEPAGKKVPSFPRRYYALEPSPGIRVVLREDDRQQVVYCAEQGLAQDVLQFCRAVGREPFRVTFEKASSAAKYWIHSAMTPRLLEREPPALRELSDPGLCFHRLPFDAVEDSSRCPLFEEFLSRCTNREAVAAFIGSLFYPEADRQQYLWLYGHGQNGKGAVARLLQRLLGPSYRSEDANFASDKFFTYGLLGKRLVLFPDSNNGAFVQSGLFKSLTGGDPVRVERKQHDPFTADLVCKLAFMSNTRPDVTGQMADRRRVIFARIDAINGDPDPAYEAKLWAEAPYILGACKALYRELCPTHGRIPVDDAETAGLADDTDEEFDVIFGTHFEANPSRSVSPLQLQRALQLAGIRDRPKAKKFKEYLERKYGVAVTRSAPKAPREYRGIGVISGSYEN